MSRINLNWTCEVGYESFEIYASSTVFTSTSLPSVWAEGITDLTYILENPPSNPTYVMIASVKGAVKRFSQLMTVSLKRDFDPELSLSVLPVAFYKLNELSGNFQDSSGNNRHLTASVNVLRNQDSIESTKNSSSATLHTNSTETWIGKRTGTVSLGTNLTFMTWLNIPDSGTPLWGEFFKLGAESKGFSLGFNNGTQAGDASAQDRAGRYILIGQNAVSFRPTTYAFSNAAQKVHVAVRFKSQNTSSSEGSFNVYVNGVKVYTQSSIGPVNTPLTDTMSVGFGEKQIGFKLLMSRVAIYNAALTDAEILSCAQISPIQHA